MWSPHDEPWWWCSAQNWSHDVSCRAGSMVMGFSRPSMGWSTRVVSWTHDCQSWWWCPRPKMSFTVNHKVVPSLSYIYMYLPAHQSSGLVESGDMVCWRSRMEVTVRRDIFRLIILSGSLSCSLSLFLQGEHYIYSHIMLMMSWLVSKQYVWIGLSKYWIIKLNQDSVFREEGCEESIKKARRIANLARLDIGGDNLDIYQYV